MKLPITKEFFAERTSYDLKHCCEECALFDTARAACAHDWPNASHLRAYYEATPESIVFCKEFELI